MRMLEGFGLSPFDGIPCETHRRVAENPCNMPYAGTFAMRKMNTIVQKRTSFGRYDMFVDG